MKEAKADMEAAKQQLDLGKPVEGKGPVGRRMVGEWRRMDQGVMLHDLKDLDDLAGRYRVLLAAAQVVQRVLDECSELRARATTPDDHSAWQLLNMRVGVTQEKLADLYEQYLEMHGTEEELCTCKEERAGRPRKDARARLDSWYDPLTASNTDGRLKVHSSLRLDDKPFRAKLCQVEKGQRAWPSPSRTGRNSAPTQPYHRPHRNAQRCFQRKPRNGPVAARPVWRLPHSNGQRRLQSTPSRCPRRSSRGGQVAAHARVSLN